MKERETAVTENGLRIVVDPEHVKELATALAVPFDPGEVRWKPQTVSKDQKRALAVAYVDARVIQDRLDEVLGVMGWQDSYECLPDGSVVCRLRIRLGGEWIEKMDVGGQSEQPDEGDRRKSAFSDALKRAAVKFGIGRYLYRLEAQWVDYDPQKKKIVSTPRLPPEALPPAAKPAPAPKAVEPVPPAAATPAPAVPPNAKKEPAGKRGKKEAEAKEAAEAKGGNRGMPANGEELFRRLQDYDDRLAREGLCRPGELVKHIAGAGVAAGYERDMTTWTEPAILLAINETKAFEGRLRQSRPREVA
jgi:hypothetical protein